jgi:hypothetical protein
VKLVPIVMSTNDKKKWAAQSAPILKEMRRTIDETITHMQQYLRRKGTGT